MTAVPISDHSPRRIVSLVPSLTELLFDLGLDDNVVGITRYCVHPTHWQNEKAIVGGTKKFDFNIITSLTPDLIVANKEENYQEGILQLKDRYKVYLTDIYDLDGALSVVKELGRQTGTFARAGELVSDIQSEFSLLKQFRRQTVLYLIWRKPWMGVARNTFIDSMLSMMGLGNVLSARERYPELSSEEISQLAPEYIFLSSEPYPFAEKHIEEIRLLSPNSKIVLVDGEMFSWYGSRLRLAPKYFNELRNHLVRTSS
ncbi:MAG TPA: helical backbone metal receptor [Chryseosolibacter sp.]|nr:helical backbone metal receptor [Chryseosolibacter sp.]